MTVLSGNTLRMYAADGAPLVNPFVYEKTIINGMSYGCSLAGYDIRVKEDIKLWTGNFTLASSVEEFHMPKNVIGFVHDKSSWARKGLSLFNTVIEPGWKGYLTLEMVYNEPSPGPTILSIPAGSPIAQIVFMYVDEVTRGYEGKYQNQKQGPVEAIFENPSTLPSL